MATHSANGGRATVDVHVFRVEPKPSSARLLKPENNGRGLVTTRESSEGLTSEDEPEISTRKPNKTGAGKTPILWRFVIGIIGILLVVIVYIIVDGRSDGKDVQSVGQNRNGKKIDDSAKRVRNVDTTIKPVGNHNLEQSDKICITKGCIETAIDIRRSMNLSVNPCDNFYEFTCGTYKPETYQVETPRQELQLKYDKIIEDKIKSTSDPEDHPVIRYARDVYQGCLNSVITYDASAVRLFIQKMLNIPNWPSPKMSALRKTYISETNAELILKFPLAPFFNVQVITPTAQTISVFKISEPQLVLPLGLRRGQQNSSSIVFDNYASHVSIVMKEYGGQLPVLSDYELRQMSEQVIRFEMALFDITSKHLNKTSFELVTVRELDALTGNAQIKISPRETMNYILKVAGRVPLVDEDKLYIFNSTVLTELLNFINSTQETVINYLGYRLALQLVPLSTNLTHLDTTNPYTLEGNPGPPLGRPSHCLKFVKHIFFPAISRHPDKAEEVQGDTFMFGDAVVKKILRMFSNIRNELILNIPKNTKLRVSRKWTSVAGIKQIRTCQDNWVLSHAELDKYYAGIYPLRTSYLDQMSSLWGWKNAESFSLHGKSLTDICPQYSDTSVYSAAFSPSLLQMIIPPTHWMEPFYNQEWPEYLKYSGLGSVLGHEIMHGLFAIVPEWVDDPGSDQVTNGMTSREMSVDMNQVFSQPTAETSQSPLKLSFPILPEPTFRTSQCLVDLYEEYSPDRKKYASYLFGADPQINGSRTFQENFSDLGGIKLAFSAYKSVLSKNGKQIVEKVLPGLTDYSNDQIFFINYARTWCEIHSPYSRREFLRVGLHSPAEFRVIGTLRNSPDFASAWKCPVGSFMNPAKKCPVF